MKHRYTIKDIAKDLNISVSTVSRALRGIYGINKETESKIKEYSKKVGYTPNLMARGLKIGGANNIGVIIPTLDHNFFASVISGIEEIAYKRGYNVILSSSNESYEKEMFCVESMISSNIRGIIISISKNTEDVSHLKTLQSFDVPIVMFDRVNSSIVCDKVIVDDYHGAYMATQHLINIGREKIAIFHSNPKMLISVNRINGFLDCMNKNHKKVDESLKVESDTEYCNTMENAYKSFEELVKQNNIPDAVFCCNDLMAAGVLQAAKDNKIRVPTDLAVCGFGNGIISQIAYPNITTVFQKGPEMGMKSAELLLNRIELKTQEPSKTHVLKTELILRGSTIIN